MKLASHKIAWSALLLTLCNGRAQAQFTTAPDGNGGVIITGYTGTGGAVDIPATIATATVTGIADEAFYHNPTTLTSVTIPDTVTAIGDNSGTFGAFNGCTSLTSVTIGAGVTSIVAGTFDDTPALTAFNVSAQNSAYGSANGALTLKTSELAGSLSARRDRHLHDSQAASPASARARSPPARNWPAWSSRPVA